MIENNTVDMKLMSKMADKNSKKVYFRKRKGCPLSMLNAPIINYKNPELLIKYISEGGRMLPSRITNVSAKKQRQLNKAIKIARILALLPFVFQG